MPRAAEGCKIPCLAPAESLLPLPAACVSGIWHQGVSGSRRQTRPGWVQFHLSPASVWHLGCAARSPLTCPASLSSCATGDRKIALLPADPVEGGAFPRNPWTKRSPGGSRDPQARPGRHLNLQTEWCLLFLPHPAWPLQAEILAPINSTWKS